MAGWPYPARAVRAVVAAERQKEYAEAAYAIGAGRTRILLRHLLPSARGVLWVQTDQPGDATGDWANIGSNVMVAVDPLTGETRRFLTSPPRCEVTGITMTPDMKTMWINIQHPGEDAPASNPTQFSAWPDMDPTGRPRAATVLITKDDGGIIGT